MLQERQRKEIQLTSQLHIKPIKIICPGTAFKIFLFNCNEWVLGFKLAGTSIGRQILTPNEAYHPISKREYLSYY